MIFYFSGTGNSRWAAKQIAAQTGDAAQDIAALKAAPSVENEHQIGLVFPVYAWGAPKAVIRFAKTLPKTNQFTFGVCTCGEEAGYAMKKLSQCFPLDSSYSLVMPNNYIIGADVDDAPTIRRKIAAAEKAIAALSEEIVQQKKVYRVQEGTFPALKSSLVHFGFNRFARSAKPFYTLPSCNGCGLCAQNCPAGAISMHNAAPQWQTQCYQCLRCINECPQKAIQYGKTTENKGRYTLESAYPSPQ